jgi:hypothetical protein
MSPDGLKAKMKDRIHNGLKAQFGGAAGSAGGYDPIADANWVKLAEAISGIAADIVMEITSNAQVNPGIATAGSPGSHVSVSPGTIS